MFQNPSDPAVGTLQPVSAARGGSPGNGQ